MTSHQERRSISLIDNIKRLIQEDKFIVSEHAQARMFERQISLDDLLDLIRHGEIIEEYPDDEPCPSALMLGYIGGLGCHVVIGVCMYRLRIITAYWASEDEWIECKKRRR